MQVLSEASQPMEVVWNDFCRANYTTWEPGFECDYHYHKDAMELFVFLEGSCEVTVPGETRVVHAGQTVYTAPGEPHKLKAVGSTPLKMFLVVVPNHEPTHTIVQADGTERDTNRQPPNPDEPWLGKGDTMPGLRGAPKAGS